MKLSAIREIKKFCDGLFSTPDWREVVSHIEDEEADFGVDNVRFISSDAIDSIQAEEMSNDPYIVGCFNSWFIADVIGIDEDVIQTMQKAEAYEAVGKLIISLGKLEELQQAYVSADGYGHYFNGYNSSEENVKLNGLDYYVFDQH